MFQLLFISFAFDFFKLLVNHGEIVKKNQKIDGRPFPEKAAICQTSRRGTCALAQTGLQTEAVCNKWKSQFNLNSELAEEISKKDFQS